MDKKPKVTEDVQRLMDMDAETIYAKDIAPIVKIHPQTIIEYAKTGKWNLCRYVISGDRVKFFRKDFLQQCGFVDPEPEGPTERQLLAIIVNKLESMLNNQRILIQLIDEQNRLQKEGPKTKWAREQGLIF